MNPLVYSSGYWRGMRTGYRDAGKSFLRRFLVALWIWTILMGTGVGFAIATAERFYQMESGESVKIIVLKKWDSWWRVKR